jgi:phosphatidylglycerol:prolipoprotein diacylglycerol transferase
LHKIAFHIGDLTIYWYGVLVALGFMVGLWTASRRAPQQGIASEKIADLGVWLIVGALVGARLFYVVGYWKEDFADKPWWEVLMIRHGGLVFFGGLAGSSLACWLYARFRGLPLWRVADVLAPSIALGHAFGRLGCLMNGCCHGSPCALPWAIHYPDEAGIIGGVHPTQVYEALLNLLLYAFLAWFLRSRKQFDGQVFALYLLLYGVLRFGVECFRGDYQVRHLGGWATPAQIIGILVILAGGLLWYQRRLASAPAGTPRRPRQPPGE